MCTHVTEVASGGCGPSSSRFMCSFDPATFFFTEMCILSDTPQTFGIDSKTSRPGAFASTSTTMRFCCACIEHHDGGALKLATVALAP
jgi:hypothetical protein